MTDTVRIHEPTAVNLVRKTEDGDYTISNSFDWPKWLRKKEKLRAREATILRFVEMTLFPEGKQGLEVTVEDELGCAKLVFLNDQEAYDVKRDLNIRMLNQRIVVYREGRKIIGISKIPRYT